MYTQFTITVSLRVQDGKWVIIGGNGDSVYTRLMAAVGRPDMGADNAKYGSNAARMEAEEEIMGCISEWVGRHTLEEVQEAMAGAR